MRHWALAFAPLGACALLYACASSPRPSVAPAAMAPPEHPMTMPAGDPRSQIEQLSQQIDQQRQQMALAPTVHPMSSVATAPVPPHAPNDPTCKPAPSETCTDSCKLSDSICDNATKICDLAKDMPGDAWAEGKCSDAKQTCSDAHAKCCGCQ